VTADGTVTVSMARTQATGKLWGGMALLFRGHNGLGNSARSAPSANETVSLTVSQGSAVGMLAIDWDALATVAFRPSGANEVERSQQGPGPDLTYYAGYWLNQPAGTTGYGIGTSSTTNLHIIAIEVLGDAATPLPLQPWPNLIGRVGGPWPRPQAPIFVPDPFVEPPANPDLVPQSTTRLSWVARRMRRTGQPIRFVPPLPDMAPANTSSRRMKPKRIVRAGQPTPPQVPPPPDVEIGQRRRRAASVTSRSAQPVPDQVVTPPTNPDLVPSTITHRARALLRRSKTAQPTPPQIVAPVNPAFIPAAITHRARALFRRSTTADTLPEQAAAPMAATARREIPRQRPSATSAPIPPQFNPPIVFVVREHVKAALRRGTGRTATPTPAQQAAPVNPAIVFNIRGRIRQAVRRDSSRTAEVVPAQQAAPTNPAFVPLGKARTRRLTRRSSHVAAPVQSGLDVPAVAHSRRTRPATRHSRTATPVPPQAAPPVNPAFVPAVIRHPRLVLRRFRRRLAEIFQPGLLVGEFEAKFGTPRLTAQFGQPRIGAELEEPRITADYGPHRLTATMGSRLEGRFDT